MIKIFKEIKAVGLPNWIWFVVYLKRDEFSENLRLSKYAFKSKNWNYKLAKDRKLAHEIEEKLSKIK